MEQRLFASKTPEGDPLPVIMTSATLATGGSFHGGNGRAVSDKNAENFKHLKRRLGCADATTLLLGSPFDYEEQAELVIAKQLPDPGDRAYFRQDDSGAAAALGGK